MLVSRGPKHKRQATVTFRVVYYLKSQPGKPHYLALGRYPDKHDDPEKVRRLASKIRNAAADDDIDPKRPVMSDLFEDVVKNFIELLRQEEPQLEGDSSALHTYVLPDWRYPQDHSTSITQPGVPTLLDRIQLTQDTKAARASC